MEPQDLAFRRTILRQNRTQARRASRLRSACLVALAFSTVGATGLPPAAASAARAAAPAFARDPVPTTARWHEPGDRAPRMARHHCAAALAGPSGAVRDALEASVREPGAFALVGDPLQDDARGRSIGIVFWARDAGGERVLQKARAAIDPDTCQVHLAAPL